jgi:3-keto-disaccharide hydrolase
MRLAGREVNPGGNSGIAFRSDNAIADYLEVDILEKATGTLVGKSMYKVNHQPIRNMPRDWFYIELEAKGNRVTTRVNDGADGAAEYLLPAKYLRSGAIAFQIFGAEPPTKDTIVKIRQVQIKELR